jgi:hypothetical protein
MLKSRNFLERYIVSELVPLLVFLLYVFSVMDSSRILMIVIVFFMGSIYISILNLVLTLLFYFLKICPLPNIIIIITVLCIAAYLYYGKIYLGNDLSSAFSRKKLNRNLHRGNNNFLRPNYKPIIRKTLFYNLSEIDRILKCYFFKKYKII